MSPPKVLVVEDEMIVARDLADRLAALGFEVPTIAGTAAEAIDAARLARPDLVLMDVRLRGDRDGISAAEELRKEMDVPIVYLTAYADHDTRMRAEATDPFGYLLKPFNEMELSCTIQMALSKHRHDAEVKVRAERLSALLGGIADGVVALDHDGRVTYVNSAATAMTGWNPAAVAGVPLQRLLEAVAEDSQSRSAAARLVEAAQRGETLELAQPLAVRREAGIHGWLTATVHGLGRPGSAEAVVTFRDVTAQVEAGASLREAEARWRSLLQHLPGQVVVLDSKGFIISAATGLLESPLRLREGQRLIDLFDDDWRQQLSTLLVATAGGEYETGPVSAELCVTSSEGARTFYSATASLIDGAARPAGPCLVVLLREITAERKLRQQLNQAQRMEALGQLAGGIAHDFNNLLAVLLSYLFFIDGGIDAASVVKSDVHEAIETANRAKGLTQQLLSFSRSQLVRPVTLDLGEVIAGLTAMLRRVIREDIEIEFAAGDEPLHIEVDRGQLEQVIMNLVLNARDAIVGPGAIRISADRVELDPQAATALGRLRAGTHHRLRVLDDGVGMDEDTRDRMFEPFFTTKAAGQGTGLGLAVVYGLVMKSRGAIHVESTAGRGTLVEIYFPAVISSDRPPSLERPRASSQTVCSVLLVEDDATLLRLSTRALQRSGFEVLGALNGVEALELVRQPTTRVDVVVSDVVMPQLGGIALARELEEALPGVPVLLTSGYAVQADDRTSANVAGFLSKPYSPQELAERIRALFTATITP